jgi:adenylate cyclase
MEKELAEPVVSFGSYRLDPRSAQLWRGTQAVKLTGKAFAVLRYFVDHPGQLVTKDDLFAAVWPETVVTESTLASCIQELRQALRDDARKPRYIETVHRRGYRFLPAITTQPVQSSKFQVPSQEEVASSQSSVSSRQQEENQQASRASSVQGLELEEPTDQTVDPRLSDARLSDPGRPTPDTAAPMRSWPRTGFVVAVVLLGVGVLLALFFPRLSSRGTQYSDLGTEQAQQAQALLNKPAIAVMPFTNMSGDLEQEYFSDGFTDDLITALSHLSGLVVIARHSVFTYKGKAVKVQEINKELGVRYVLEGSVRKTDGQVRINAQLVDALTGHHLWSERYDRPLTETFVLQDAIVQQIVTTLQLRLTLVEQGTCFKAHKSTRNMAAYDAFMRGAHAYMRFTQEANRQARQFAEQAIELDPQYAEAYALLGWTYWVEWGLLWSQDPQVVEQALTFAQQAKALDDFIPTAHELLGHIYLWKDQREQAIAAAERAITVSPNDDSAYVVLGTILLSIGRPEEAIDKIQQAMRLNPHYPAYSGVFLGAAYRLTGRYAEALTTLKKALTRDPNYMPTYLQLAATYSELDQLEEARAAAAEVLRLSPNFSLESMRQLALQKDQAALERTLAALRKAGLK